MELVRRTFLEVLRFTVAVRGSQPSWFFWTPLSLSLTSTRPESLAGRCQRRLEGAGKSPRFDAFMLATFALLLDAVNKAQTSNDKTKLKSPVHTVAEK